MKSWAASLMGFLTCNYGHTCNFLLSIRETTDGRSTESSQPKTSRCCFNLWLGVMMETDCLAKYEDVKCFECSEREHVALKCPKNLGKRETTAQSFSANRDLWRWYWGMSVTRLIDERYSCDISLLSKKQYLELGFSHSRMNPLFFTELKLIIKQWTDIWRIGWYRNRNW